MSFLECVDVLMVTNKHELNKYCSLFSHGLASESLTKIRSINDSSHSESLFRG
uniref:Uncharacterized protein n=1 Tax=Arion vulgaris TaxID=1028688 RepID=A0A0B7AMC3_9EUPU